MPRWKIGADFCKNCVWFPETIFVGEYPLLWLKKVPSGYKYNMIYSLLGRGGGKNISHGSPCLS